MDPRTVTPKTPPRVIVAAVLIGLFLISFIVFAVWQSGAEIKAARMSGTIVSKEFVPAPERQVTIARDGGAVTARKTAGEYIIQVEVPGPDGTKKPYNVWIDESLYQQLNVGDSFDVGPYLVPPEKK